MFQINCQNLQFIFSCIGFLFDPFPQFSTKTAEADTSSELAKKSKEVFRKEVSFRFSWVFYQIIIVVAHVSDLSNLSISPAYLFRCHSLLCIALIRTASQIASWAVSVTQMTLNILLER